MMTTVVSVHKDYFPSDPNTSNSTWSLNTTITSYLCDIWFVFAHLFVFHPVRSTLVNTTHSFIHAFVIFIGVPGSYLWSLIQQATLVSIFSTTYFFLRLLINSFVSVLSCCLTRSEFWVCAGLFFHQGTIYVGSRFFHSVRERQQKLYYWGHHLFGFPKWDLVLCVLAETFRPSQQIRT